MRNSRFTRLQQLFLINRIFFNKFIDTQLPLCCRIHSVNHQKLTFSNFSCIFQLKFFSRCAKMSSNKKHCLKVNFHRIFKVIAISALLAAQSFSHFTLHPSQAAPSAQPQTAKQCVQHRSNCAPTGSENSQAHQACTSAADS